MKIFLAGATGAIGRRLLPRLRAAGHSILAMTRSPVRAGQLQSLGVRAVVLDAFDRDGLAQALERERPEVVMHQLTDLTARDFQANNRLRIEGTRNLVDAARAAGVKRMVAQSLASAYAPGAGPAREDEPLDLQAPPPRGRMVEGVAALERAVAEMPVGVILRYGFIYGPGTWYARGGWAERQMYRGELKVGRGVASFVHVEDAAEAAMLALQWPAGPVNIVDDEPASMAAWLTALATALSTPLPQVADDPAPRERGASNAKARRDLGWTPRYPTWREGFVLGLD
jgi:nucleoside-diphosphate-sugar epimerase